MRCFQNSSDTLCSGVDGVISKLDFSTLGVRYIKIFFISSHERREGNDFVQVFLESSRQKKKKYSLEYAR